MEIPFIGLLILILAAWFFVFSPRLLYVALIVSIPFSATAVVNFLWGGEAYGGAEKDIMAWQLFAVLWVLREAISGIPPWHRLGWFRTKSVRARLLVFLAALAASLTVPLLLNGTAWVWSWANSLFYRGPAEIPLRFTLFNITQSAYVVFGVLFAVFIAAENSQSKRLLHTLKLYVSSCVFAAAWGLIQLWCNVAGYTYAASIFNTGKNFSALGYTETLGTGSLATIGRISSVATEPSVLAEELLLAFVVLMVCLGFRRPILRRGWNWFAIVLIGVVLLASTSTTAYAGMFAAPLLSAVALALAGSRRWRHYVAVTTIVLAVGALLVVCLPLGNTIYQAAIMLKYVNGSGVTRLESVRIAAQDFLRYPILGVGWGAVTSWDLLFLLLANTGIIGALAFGGFLVPVIKGLWRLAAQRNFAASVLLPAIVLALMLAEGDGLSYGIGYYWFIFGLAAGVSASKYRSFFGTARLGPNLHPVSQ